jgi:hypothetical protein
VRVRCPSRADELAVFLRRCDCAVELVGPGLLEISPHQAKQQELARLELDGLLRVWQAMQPDSEGEVVFLGAGSEETAQANGVPGTDSAQALQAQIEHLVVERHRLRRLGAEAVELEHNRRALAACQRQLSWALIAEAQSG